MQSKPRRKGKWPKRNCRGWLIKHKMLKIQSVVVPLAGLSLLWFFQVFSFPPGSEEKKKKHFHSHGRPFSLFCFFLRGDDFWNPGTNLVGQSPGHVHRVCRHRFSCLESCASQRSRAEGVHCRRSRSQSLQGFIFFQFSWWGCTAANTKMNKTKQNNREYGVARTSPSKFSKLITFPIRFLTQFES